MLVTSDNLNMAMMAHSHLKKKKVQNFAQPLTTLENGSTPSSTA